MSNPSLFQIEQKNALHSNVPWLIAMKVHITHPTTGAVVDVMRIVRNDEPIKINGEVYEAMIFEMDMKRRLGELPSVSVSVQDHHGLVAAKMHDFKGGVGSKVDLMIFPVENGEVEGEPDLTEYFEIVGASSAGFVAKWELGVENPLSVTFPKRKQYSNRCGWHYRDEDCAYAGPLTSCDYTLDGPRGCRAHGNSRNFGGLPGLRNQ